MRGGARKCWRREPLGGSGGMLPQKNLGVCFYFLGKKLWGGARAPPAPPLATAVDHIDLQSQVNNGLGKINSWFQANKLSLNVKKTKYSIISKQFKSAQLDHLSVYLNITMSPTLTTRLHPPIYSMTLAGIYLNKSV